jgi:hypothetical protein
MAGQIWLEGIRYKSSYQLARMLRTGFVSTPTLVRLIDAWPVDVDVCENGQKLIVDCPVDVDVSKPSLFHLVGRCFFFRVAK